MKEPNLDNLEKKTHPTDESFERSQNEIEADGTIEDIDPLLFVDEEKEYDPEESTMEKVGKKIRKKLSWQAITNISIALIGTLAVATIFLIIFVALNPQQAKILTWFGFDLGFLQRTLTSIFKWTYGVISAIVVGIWLFSIFKVFISKDKAIKFIFGVVTFFLFIGILALIPTYAKLLRIIETTDFLNTDNRVILYDNDLYKAIGSEDPRQAQIQNYSSIIGPIEIRYDMSGFLRKNRSNYLQQLGFSVDFDGDGNADVEGRQLTNDTLLVWNYDKKTVFTPVGSMLVQNLEGEVEEISMEFPTSLTIDGLVNTEVLRTTSEWVEMLFDATDLRQKGKTAWYTSEKWFEQVVGTNYAFTPDHLLDASDWVCVSIFVGNEQPEGCDRIFVFDAVASRSATGDIILIADNLNPFKYTFSLKNLELAESNTDDIDWVIYDDSKTQEVDRISQAFFTEEYVFRNTGTYYVIPEITDTAGNIYAIETQDSKVDIFEPVSFQEDKTLSIVADGQVLDTEFDAIALTYSLDEPFVGPVTLAFDATKVRLQDRDWKIANMTYDFNEDGIADLQGLDVEYDFFREDAYTAVITYEFKNQVTGAMRTYKEFFDFDIVDPDFIVQVDINIVEKFAPTNIVFDASASSIKGGEIIEFMYEFSDSDSAFKGSSVYERRIGEPGTYSVTVTAITDSWEEKSVTEEFRIAKKQDQPIIGTSIAPHRLSVGNPVTFDALESIGVPVEAIWRFGDGNTKTGIEAEHVYENAGSYTVELEVTFAGGNILRTTKRVLVR